MMILYHFIYLYSETRYQKLTIPFSHLISYGVLMAECSTQFSIMWFNQTAATAYRGDWWCEIDDLSVSVCVLAVLIALLTKQNSDFIFTFFNFSNSYLFLFFFFLTCFQWTIHFYVSYRTVCMSFFLFVYKCVCVSYRPHSFQAFFFLDPEP